jgi:hypothetical protein
MPTAPSRGRGVRRPLGRLAGVMPTGPFLDASLIA